MTRLILGAAIMPLVARVLAITEQIATGPRPRRRHLWHPAAEPAPGRPIPVTVQPMSNRQLVAVVAAAIIILSVAMRIAPVAFGGSVDF